MTVCICPAVRCDGENCGDGFAASFFQMPNGHGRFGASWQKDAWKEAKEAGWKRIGKLEFCPRCARMGNTTPAQSGCSPTGRKE